MSRFDTLRDGISDARPSVLGGDESDSESTDPHRWRDSRSKTWRERITPDTPKRQMAALSAALLIAGLMLFFLRFIPTAPHAFAFVGGVTAAPLAYYYGYKKGVTTMRRLDVSIIFNPASNTGVRVRAGKIVNSSDDDAVYFMPLSAEAFAGLQQRYIRLIDVFGRDTNVAEWKAARGDAKKTRDADRVAEYPVVDKLPAPFTTVINSDAYGRVAVTLSGGISKRPQKAEYDREVEMPDLASRETMREVRNFVAELTDDIEHLQRRVSRLQERARGRDSELDRRTQEYLDDLVTFLDELPTTARGRRSGSRRSSGSDDDGAGAEVSLDAVRDVDEEVADRLEEQGDLS